MAAPILRPLSTGEVLDISFGLYRSLFYPLVIVALACRTIPILLGIYLQQISGSSPTAVFDHWPLLLAQFVLAMLLNVLAVAATTFLVSGAYLGHPMTADTALHQAFKLLGPLTLVSFLSSIAIGLGFVVLIVPGVILLSGLILATAVVALEQPVSAVGAMNRSWELTKGFRAKVFVAVFVAALLFAIPTMIVSVMSAVGSMTGVWSPLIPEILLGVLQIFVYPFLYIVVTVLYYDLRVRKEGFDLELLATATQPAA
jgi:hypothetical protein